ncbi:MAG: glycosyltransferase family 2 protein [Candidatus Saganbacteria bacterium]|nr:glycosyltransferase family 2 protein [Candidatus Saganbacteria bacterium]
MTQKLVSVITPSHRRVNRLLRAVEAVRAQEYQRIEHIIIVGDKHPQLSGELGTRILEINPQAVILNLQTSKDIVYGAQRAAIARNAGIDRASGDYISHLDDDNVIEPNHIASLVETLEGEGVQAAHSWRKLFQADGTPFILDSYPWAVAPYLARYLFDKFVEANMFVPGTNEVHDQMITPAGDPVLHVDTSEWLICADLHRRARFDEHYGLRQIIQHQTDDFRLAEAFHQMSVPIAPTEQATLHYFLGGYSNE